MKVPQKKLVALLTVAVMAAALLMSAVSLMPQHAFAETTADFATPAGYNDNDYQKLVVFMETVNSSGGFSNSNDFFMYSGTAYLRKLYFLFFNPPHRLLFRF